MANNDIRNAKQLATFIREEDLDDLGSIKRDLEAKAHQAREDGRVYLLQQYTRLLAIIGPEIKRVERRFERENLAYLRKEGKRLKEELKTQSGPADEA